LSRKQKHAFVLGTAYFDWDKCLVCADKKACILCEEHCPAHNKANISETIATTDFLGNFILLKHAYVDRSLCIGCGLCEHICPVDGQAAIRVAGKSKNQKQEAGYGQGYN
jgi:NAD-dependent dihydropyrimidine dehydrogenase PreA subunit